MTEFDTSQLLLSKRLGEVRIDPCCFFCIDDYLPDDFYQVLRETFPDESTYEKDDSKKMGFRSSVESDPFDTFCDANPAWRQLIDFFSSEEFSADVRKALAPALLDARGIAERRPWLDCTQRAIPNNPLRYFFQEPTRTTFQISLLPRDGVVVPHTDAPRKLVSLLLYFRDLDWEDSYGGATEFYTPLDPDAARGWAPTDRIPFEQFKVIGTAGFKRNRLSGFVRSDASFHGVPPITCPPGMARRALLINIKRLKWSKRHEP
jgi:hypothetical protein